MIKVNDVFTKDGVNYEARVIVCDVVVKKMIIQLKRMDV